MIPMRFYAIHPATMKPCMVIQITNLGRFQAINGNPNAKDSDLLDLKIISICLRIVCVITCFQGFYLGFYNIKMFTTGKRNGKQKYHMYELDLYNPCLIEFDNSGTIHCS